MLSDQELADLKSRCVYSKTYGYQIAGAPEYAKALGYAGEPPPPKVKKFSPAHLLHLIAMKQEVKAPQAPAKRAPGLRSIKRKESVPPPETSVNKNEDLPTVPVDPAAVRAAADAMRQMRDPDDET